MASQGIINNNKDRNKYFLCEEIDNNLICSICSGVLINPVQFKCCKKTVCKDCVLPSTNKESPDHNKCPICSCESLAFEQTFALNGVVQNMQICCMNNIDPRHPRQGNLTEYDDRNLESIGNYSSMCYCSWTGNLSEWCDHNKNSCQLCEVSCSVVGCDFTGRRKDMEIHNSSSIVDHMQLLFGQRMLSVENNLSDREKGKKKTENDIKSLKAQFKNFQTKVHKEIKDLKKTIENTREEHETTINGFTIRLQKGLDKKMDSNIVSIKEKKTEKVLEQITRKLFVELKSELELATEFIIDAKSEDLKIDIEETAKTIKEKLERDFNDRFVNFASSIYSDIQRDLEHDLYRITDEKTKILE